MPFAEPLRPPAVDDPRKVVKVVASDGKTGDQKDLSYTNCKVIGNGSFGIVFQARLLDDPADGDIAIKKVLQDKRFKVGPSVCYLHRTVRETSFWRSHIPFGVD